MTTTLLIGGGVLALVLLVVGIVVSATGDKTSMDDRLNNIWKKIKRQNPRIQKAH
jgi:glucose uptake protein GlcU